MNNTKSLLAVLASAVLMGISIPASASQPTERVNSQRDRFDACLVDSKCKLSDIEFAPIDKNDKPTRKLIPPVSIDR